MKIQSYQNKRRSESGLISVVFLVLMAIMVILVAANSRSLAHLHRETKLLERQQIQRLAEVGTNGVAAVPLNSGALPTNP